MSSFRTRGHADSRLPALKIAGGLILLLFALHMVLGEEKKGDAEVANPSTDIAVYPLAMPLMATPQGIVAIVTIVAAMLIVGVMSLGLQSLATADQRVASG